MFGFTPRSKTTATLLSVAILASALAPTAFAASAGNSFEIPFAHSHAYYSSGTTPTNSVTNSRIRNSAPPVVQGTTTNPNCLAGHDEMDRSGAGSEGAGLLMPCHG